MKSYIDTLPKEDLTSFIFWPQEVLVEVDSQNLRKAYQNTLGYYHLIYKKLVDADDSPYKDKNLLIVLNKIIESKILSDNGIIVIHRHKKELDEFPKNFKIIEEKKYGISKIIFAKN